MKKENQLGDPSVDWRALLK